MMDSLTTIPSSSVNDHSINFDPLPQILDANFHEEIINVMSLSGFDKIATRLEYLYQIIQDSDDPEMNFKSLQNLAIFLLNTTHYFQILILELTLRGYYRLSGILGMRLL